MKIKKVDDKPMVIHTKEKAKIHAHEPKGAKIKGSNIYTVERGPKVHDAKANEMDKKASAKLMLQKSAGGKRTYRKSTIHQSEAIYELLNTPRRAREVRSQFYNTGIQVHLNKMSMEWFIENKSMDKHSVAATKTYGTSRMDAYSIFEDTLNLKDCNSQGQD